MNLGINVQAVKEETFSQENKFKNKLMWNT